MCSVTKLRKEAVVENLVGGGSGYIFFQVKTFEWYFLLFVHCLPYRMTLTFKSRNYLNEIYFIISTQLFLFSDKIHFFPISSLRLSLK